MRRSLLTLSFALMLAAGCVPVGASSGSSEQGGDGANIINGRPDAEHRNVFLLEHVHGSGASRKIGHCTGTLIGSHTVLTAAHCAVDGDEWTVFVDDRVAPFHVLSPPVRDPLWTNTVGDARHDLAVLLLDREVTGIEPARLLRDAPSKGEDVTLVGFGVTNGGFSGEKRYSGTDTISVVASGVFLTESTARTQAAGAPGDSGGPAFVGRGSEVALGGVMSLSDTCRQSSGLSDCLQTFITRVDDRLPWISEEAHNNLYDGGGYDPTPLPIRPQGNLAISIEPPDTIVADTPFTLTVSVTDDLGVAQISITVDGIAISTQTFSDTAVRYEALLELSEGTHLIGIDVREPGGGTEHRDLTLIAEALL